MKVIKNLVPESKYSIKCPYTMKPTRIVVHNTANDASAKNEIAYMRNNNLEVSFHYAVDDKEIVQGIPENRNAWHAGDGGNGKGNREGIAIEICYSKSGGEKFTKAEKNAVDLIVDILKRYGWGIDKVTKHQDYNKKYCPHRTLDIGWDRFIKMIDAKLNPKPTIKTLYRVRKTWKDAASQIGAYESLTNAKKACKSGYSVFDIKGNVVYTPETKATIKAGSTVKLNKGAKTYTGGKIASFVYNRNHKVKEINGQRVVITYLGIVVAAVKLSDLTLVK
jgi:N-acetylmuramoyl-L-alanine amidase CwlA